MKCLAFFFAKNSRVPPQKYTATLLVLGHMHGRGGGCLEKGKFFSERSLLETPSKLNQVSFFHSQQRRQRAQGLKEFDRNLRGFENFERSIVD